MKLSSKVAMALVAAFLVGTAVAPAAQKTTDVHVRAHVIPVCHHLRTVENIDFGRYDVFDNHSKDARGTVSFECTEGTYAYLTIDGGNNERHGQRNLTQHGNNHSHDALAYDLYKDWNHTDLWKSSGKFDREYVSTDGHDQWVHVYGRLPRNQNVPVGHYHDTVTVTLNY